MITQCSQKKFDFILSPCNYNGNTVNGVVVMKMRDIAPLGVRMKPEVKEALKKIAKEQGRSLNSEIVHRLKESLKMDGVMTA